MTLQTWTYVASEYNISEDWIDTLHVIKQEDSYVGGIIIPGRSLASYSKGSFHVDVSFETSFEGTFKLMSLYDVEVQGAVIKGRVIYFTAAALKAHDNSRSGRSVPGKRYETRVRAINEFGIDTPWSESMGFG